MHEDTFAPNSISHEVGHFCTRIKKDMRNTKKNLKKLQDKLLKKKLYWPRVKVKVKSDSKTKNKVITNYLLLKKTIN